MRQGIEEKLPLFHRSRRLHTGKGGGSESVLITDLKYEATHPGAGR